MNEPEQHTFIDAVLNIDAPLSGGRGCWEKTNVKGHHYSMLPGNTQVDSSDRSSQTA